MNLKQLHKAALKAQSMSYAPYSKFNVGAALIDEHDNIYSGCNVENAAYPISCCAEQSAVSQMIVNGGQTIKQILIIGKSGEACPPCGACRQVILEHSDHTTQIHLESSEKQFTTLSINDLLPNAFDGSKLDN